MLAIKKKTMPLFVTLAAVFVLAWAVWTMFLVPNAPQPSTPSPATPVQPLPH